MKQILVELQESMGSDKSVANAAWTSTYDKNKRDSKYNNDSKVDSIVERLILDGHGVPIESVIFRFWIRMPIHADRQFMTHRIQSANGLSGRYRTMPLDYYDVPDEVLDIFQKCEYKHIYKKAMGHDKLNDSLYQLYIKSCETAVNNYRITIDILKESEKQGLITNQEFKRAREIVRGQLPTSGMTERTTIMNLRSFANFQKQRNSEHAQPEIRFVAQKMLEEVEKANICPIAIKTLKDIGWKI